jgi:hypothetical protein
MMPRRIFGHREEETGGGENSLMRSFIICTIIITITIRVIKSRMFQGEHTARLEK